jgi:conjugal transfer pilus assembly protein TrbC
MSISIKLLPLALLLAASLSLAQGTFLERDESNRLPTPGEIELARQKTQEALNRLPDAPVIRQQFGGVTPRVEAMPRPATPAPDIASIAEKFKSLGRGLASQKGAAPDLMVFVSLSMPREALGRIIDQSERTGATLVFRGLKGDSMTRMGEEIQRSHRQSHGVRRHSSAGIPAIHHHSGSGGGDRSAGSRQCHG